MSNFGIQNLYGISKIGGTPDRRTVAPVQPITIPNINYGLYQPTAPVNLANLFPSMSNPYLSGMFNTAQQYNPYTPSYGNTGMFGAGRFLNPGITSGLLNSSMPTTMSNG